MSEHNGNGHNVPILGGKKPRAGTGLNALVRKLDDDGTFEPGKAIQTANGIAGIPSRAQIVDAEDLVEMMRAMVREELAAALGKREETS